MHTATNSLDVENFKAEFKTMFTQLITEFSEERSRQILSWYGHFAKGDRTTDYDLTTVFERIQALARRETAFLFAPTLAESERLEQEWHKLNEEFHHVLLWAYSELAWDDLKEQMDRIAYDARSHRDVWAAQFKMQVAADAHCQRLILKGEIDEAKDLREDVLGMLRGTVQTITTTSGLNHTLSPN